MVVALSALHRAAQENLRGLRGGLHATFIQLVCQKVGRTVEVLICWSAASSCRDKVRDHPIIVIVVPETVLQVLLHAFTMGQRIAAGTSGTTNQQVGPDSGPVAGVLLAIGIAQQSLD